MDDCIKMIGYIMNPEIRLIIYKLVSVRHTKQFVSITKPQWFILFTEIIAVKCNAHITYTHIRCVNKM